jgi:hypothetical protein
MPERMRVGGECTRTGAEDGAAAGHVVELHHALRDVEGMMIGQRDHAGAELDALGALAGGSQEHFRRSDGLPARGMVLAAPEFVVAEVVELLDEIEVAAELQHRMLADRVMRGEEGSELEARHRSFSPDYCYRGLCANLRGGRKQGNAPRPRHPHGCCANQRRLPPSGMFPSASTQIARRPQAGGGGHG